MTRWLATSDADFPARFAAFLAEKRESGSALTRQVADIIARVRNEGDAALYEYCQTLDNFTPPQKWEVEKGGEERGGAAKEGGRGGSIGEEKRRKAKEKEKAKRKSATRQYDFTIPAEALQTATGLCEPETLAALRLAATRIEAFHRRQLPENLWFRDTAGVDLGYQWKPLSSVGLYVPGGTAIYPSSVLMNAIPARIAGVHRIVMTTPTPRGFISPLLLAAAEIAGVTTICRLGGAQAIAALAFGSESIPPVDKIIGPGNAWVAEAKRQVFGICGIDSIAGPSEIVILADSDNKPEWLAADLLSQAEHDASSRSVLITNDREFAQRVAAALHHHLDSLPRRSIARAAWENFGAIILVSSLHEEGIALVDRLAPEHLEIATADAETLARRVHNAGAIFLGAHTPETIGDYIGGSNHVLPTNGSARFASALSVLDFLKRSSLLRCTPQSLAKLGPAAITLADAEGLQAHADAVRLRLADAPSTTPRAQP